MKLNLGILLFCNCSLDRRGHQASAASKSIPLRKAVLDKFYQLLDLVAVTRKLSGFQLRFISSSPVRSFRLHSLVSADPTLVVVVFFLSLSLLSSLIATSFSVEDEVLEKPKC